MINFFLGFISCFIFLAIVASIKIFIAKRKNNKHKQNSRVVKPETTIAVLNSGGRNKKIIKDGFFAAVLKKYIGRVKNAN